MITRNSSLICLTALLALTGCSTSSSKLLLVNLGDSKANVQATLGSPRLIRGAFQTKFGESVEVWEYHLSTPRHESLMEQITRTGAPSVQVPSEDYWFYFVNGRLARWTLKGDWRQEQQRIPNTQFLPPQE